MARSHTLFGGKSIHLSVKCIAVLYWIAVLSPEGGAPGTNISHSWEGEMSTHHSPSGVRHLEAIVGPANPPAHTGPPTRLLVRPPAFLPAPPHPHTHGHTCWW